MERHRLVWCLLAHPGMRGAGMLRIVFVEIRIHRRRRSSTGPDDPPSRASGVRQKNSSKSIGSSFLMISISRLMVSGVSAGKPRMYPANVMIPCAFQASSILRYSVILFCRFFAGDQIVGVDILQPDEDSRDAGPFRLRYEVRDLVTKRVDLDQEAERDAMLFAKLDQTIEDRFPFLVASEVVVGDEKLVNALRPAEAHEMLDVVRRAVARFATLHVDDGAERALVWAAAAGVETGALRQACVRRIASEGTARACPRFPAGLS